MLGQPGPCPDSETPLYRAGSESIPWSSCTLLVPGQAGESSRAWLPRGFHGVEALFLPAGCKIALQVSEQKAGQSAEEEGGEERSFAGEEAVPRWGIAQGGWLQRPMRRGGSSILPDTRFFSLPDPVAFGEVVTEPPTITSRPRSGGPTEKVRCGGTELCACLCISDLPHLCPQAGRKRLLLTPRLGQSRAAPTVPVSMARQRIVQEERARVIQAYRDIQRRKQQQRDAARGSTQPSSRVPG